MEARYSPHGTYQASGIESCPMRPEHWSITRLKFICELNPSKSQIAYWDPLTTVTFLPMEAIGENGELDVSNERRLKDVRSGYTFVAEGDVCIAKITPCFENGKGAVISGTRNGVAFATTEVIPFRCARNEDASFLYYLLTSAPFKPDAEASMYGAGGQKRVADSFAANYSVVLPPPVERTQIAKFLDYETAKIDTLIEKQRQLIALLNEKRQAVISHAVTKGLNPDAPMRDSGVEWLGDVPSHWEVRAVSKCIKKITNGYVGPTRDILVDEGVSYVQATHIKKGVVDFDGAYFVRQEWSVAHSKSILREGDVLIVQTGAGTGDVGLVSQNEDGFNCHALIILTSDSRVMLGAYLSIALQSEYGRSVLYSIRTGGMHPHLNCGEVKFVKLPVPPLDEQKAIARQVEKQLLHFGGLEAKALQAVELLQERRAALVSAAVTGKIDVRSWKPPESKPQTEAA